MSSSVFSLLPKLAGDLCDSSWRGCTHWHTHTLAQLWDVVLSRRSNVFCAVLSRTRSLSSLWEKFHLVSYGVWTFMAKNAWPEETQFLHVHFIFSLTPSVYSTDIVCGFLWNIDHITDCTPVPLLLSHAIVFRFQSKSLHQIVCSHTFSCYVNDVTYHVPAACLGP